MRFVGVNRKSLAIRKAGGGGSLPGVRLAFFKNQNNDKAVKKSRDKRKRNSFSYFSLRFTTNSNSLMKTSQIFRFFVLNGAPNNQRVEEKMC